MKTLSIQQPWASLICAGIKDVENRTWKAAKVPGKILIHASSAKVPKDFFDCIPEEWESNIANHIFFGNLPQIDEMPTSAIIGYVTVVGLEKDYRGSLWDGGPDQYKWELEDAWLFDEPIRNVSGKLHLFEYDLDENNLPPAHKVELKQVKVEGDELVVPTTDKEIERIIKEKIEIIEFYVLSENAPIICKNTSNGFVYEPQKTVRIVGEKKTIRFELSEGTDVCFIPQADDETKPMMITYHDGTEGEWQVLQLILGKQL